MQLRSIDEIVSNDLTGPLSVTYDVLCVGASPLMMLEALHHQREGRRTLIVESRDSLGGAWQYFSILGLPAVEIAPHAFTYNKKAYAYFAESLGLSLHPLSPEPIYLRRSAFGQIRVPFVVAPIAALVTVPLNILLEPSRWCRLSELMHEFSDQMSDAAKMVGRWIFQGERPRLYYPRGGTIAMMKVIHERMEASDVEVALRTKVNEIRRLPDGTLEVGLDQGKLRVREVRMTRHHRIGKVANESEEHAIHYIPCMHTVVHMLVRTQSPQPFSYILAKRSLHFNFASDITSITPGLSEGTRLFTFRLIRWHKKPRDRAAVEALVAEFRDSGILARDSELIDFAFSEFNQGKMTWASIVRTRKLLGDSATIFRSTEFARVIGSCVDRWRASEPSRPLSPLAHAEAAGDPS